MTNRSLAAVAASKLATWPSRLAAVSVVLLVLGAIKLCGWESLNTGATETFWGCAGLQNHVVYAVGNSGAIVRSDDDGDNWYYETCPVSGTLEAICGFDGKFIVGDNGVILRKVSGDWTECTSNTTQNLMGVQSTWGGIAVGGHGTILTTTSGITWTPATSHTTYDLYGVSYAYGAFYVVVVGAHGTVVRSTDHGSTWATASSGTTNFLFSACQVPNESIVVAVGKYGTIIRSTNRGATWTSISSPTGEDLYSVRLCGGVRPNITLTAVGPAGTIINSEDFGLTWTIDNSGTSSQLNWVDCFDGSLSSFVVGVDGIALRRAPLGGTQEPKLGNPIQPVLAAFPNPSTRVAVLSFTMPTTSRVTLTLSDASGKTVRTLVNSRVSAGVHDLIWDGANDVGQPLGVGIYFCNLRVGSSLSRVKLVKLD
jgi:photosystem II stability/assembly factor-like uncharacterized protein